MLGRNKSKIVCEGCSKMLSHQRFPPGEVYVSRTRKRGRKGKIELYPEDERLGAWCFDCQAKKSDRILRLVHSRHLYADDSSDSDIGKSQTSSDWYERRDYGYLEHTSREIRDGSYLGACGIHRTLK